MKFDSTVLNSNHPFTEVQCDSQELEARRITRIFSVQSLKYRIYTAKTITHHFARMLTNVPSSRDDSIRSLLLSAILVVFKECILVNQMINACLNQLVTITKKTCSKGYLKETFSDCSC